MEDERSPSEDHHGPSVGPRIQISDEQQQSEPVAVDETTESDIIAAQQPTAADNDADNTDTHLHVPTSVKGHSLAR